MREFLLLIQFPIKAISIQLRSQCCCQGLETQGRGQGRGLELQGQGQGLGPALINTFLVGTEQKVMSLVVYCRCHVTDKQRSALDIKEIRDSYTRGN